MSYIAFDAIACAWHYAFMKTAIRILYEKSLFPGGHILQLVVWYLPEPVAPCTHLFKYSLFYGRAGERLVAYDNERGKGDHKHIHGDERPYVFVSVGQLLRDFREDVLLHCGTELKL